MFELPKLSFELNGLEPYISEKTLSFHYGKHHQGYVKKLNELIQDSHYQKMSLEEIILTANGDVFNNAAQVWNHSFFWKCLTPQSSKVPRGELAEKINTLWGEFNHFQAAFTRAALSHFGSGWIWLVQDNQGMAIVSTHDAQTPVKLGRHALLTLDVWEHSYYLDYQNSRGDYVKNFWNVVNWDFVASQWER